MPVHPTQVYAILDGLILLGLLTAFFPRRKRDGEVMALLMVTYPVTRFLIEGLRDDEPAIFLGMTLSQGISLLILAGGLVAWAGLWTRPKGLFRDHERAASAIGTTSATHNLRNDAPGVSENAGTPRRYVGTVSSPVGRKNS